MGNVTKQSGLPRRIDCKHRHFLIPHFSFLIPHCPFFIHCIQYGMDIFCLLWVPLFYLARRPVSSGEGGKGILILLMGSVVVFLHSLTGDFVPPGGFGLSRWMSGFVDFIVLPVLFPFAVSLLLVRLRVFPPHIDHSGFILLWLIPMAVFRSIEWNSYPVFMVLVPLLWTALAAGIPFFTNLMIKHSRKYIIAVLLAICLLALPFAAATCWWAFYCQLTLPGFLFLGVSLLPLIISLIVDFSR